MAGDDERQERATCPTCGAANRRGAAYCNSCGTRLERWDDPDLERETVIDVSGDRPRVLDDEPTHTPWRGRVQTWEFGGTHVSFSGGRRACLLTVVAVLLLFCCVCVVLREGAGGFFDVNWV